MQTQEVRTSKVCRECKTEKSLSEFHIDRTLRDGHRAKCKECTSKHCKKYFKDLPPEEKKKRLEATRKWREKNPEAYKRSYINSSIKKKGLETEEYEKLQKIQNDVCAICIKPQVYCSGKSGEPDRLCIDHDHSTGFIRGLLCHICNKGIGCFCDSPKIMLSGVKYLCKSAGRQRNIDTTEIENAIDKVIELIDKVLPDLKTI